MNLPPPVRTHLPDGERPTVLNVDDDEAARYVRTRVLQRAGWTVTEAADGHEALRLARERHPDLVLLDVRLPGLGGIEVCRLLKGDPATAGIMVLQTSAELVRTEDRVRGLESGADHYLAQPFGADELLASAHALLRIRRAESSMREAAEQARVSALRLARQNERLELLAEATAELLQADDVDEMLQRLFARLRAPLRLDVYFHYALDHGALRLASHGGLDPAVLAGAQRLEIGQAVCGMTARNDRQMAVCGVLASDDPLVAFIRGCGLDAYACTPLRSKERLVGTLGFGRRHAEPFDDEDLRFLRTLCGYVAVARERILSEQRVREQSAELQEADRRKDEFLAILAHELRNPLASIGNAAAVLKALNRQEDERIERWRGTIERQLKHLARMVDDLLDVARISQGKIVLRREVVRLDAVLDSAVESVTPLLEARGHALDVRIDAPVPEVEGDLTRLTQIVANLLGNAAKYTPPGGHVALRARAEGAWLRLEVQDDGIGIDTRMQPRLFRLFAQADHSLERSQGGLGVGLALTRKLVEMHGGRIGAWSAGPGQGSTFHVELPLHLPPSGPGT